MRSCLNAEFDRMFCTGIKLKIRFQAEIPDHTVVVETEYIRIFSFVIISVVRKNIKIKMAVNQRCINKKLRVDQMIPA